MKYTTKVNLANKASSQTLVHDLVQKFAAGLTLNILDVGCSSGYLGETLKDVGHTVWGVDPDPDAALAANQVLDYCFQGTVEDFFQHHQKQRFNIIIFADVLEHTLDPLNILQLCKAHLTEQGAIIASVPNVAHLSVRTMLLEGRWEYAELGILDRTHIKFFTRRTLIQLFSDAAYQIFDLYPVRISVEHANQISGLELNTDLLKKTDDLLKFDDNRFDFQYVLLAQPSTIETATETNTVLANKVGIKILCFLITDINATLVELRLRLPLEHWAFEYGGYIRYVQIFEYTQEDIAWADICVFHREGAGNYGIQLIRLLKQLNKKVVFEIDDLLTDLPAFLLNHKQSVKNKKYLSQSLSLVDAITVTTERLGKQLAQYNSNIHCVPNCSEALTHTAKHYAVDTQHITLILASSDSILIDFIIQALQKLQQQFNIHIIAIGPITEHLNNAGITIKKIDRMDYNGFKKFIASIDNIIGLIPLDDSLFSSCKSAIKYFDYSVAGIPTICSNVPPYADHIIHGETGFLVENTTDAWFSSVEMLIKHHQLRQNIADAAAHYVHQHYNWSIAAKTWQELVNSFYNDILTERKNRQPLHISPFSSLERKRFYFKLKGFFFFVLNKLNPFKNI